jgi:hypothetical protein
VKVKRNDEDEYYKLGSTESA